MSEIITLSPGQIFPGNAYNIVNQCKVIGEFGHEVEEFGHELTEVNEIGNAGRGERELSLEYRLQKFGLAQQSGTLDDFKPAATSRLLLELCHPTAWRSFIRELWMILLSDERCGLDECIACSHSTVGVNGSCFIMTLSFSSSQMGDLRLAIVPS